MPGRDILMVSRLAPPVFSGSGYQAVALARELAKRGERITLFTTGGGRFPYEREIDEGVEQVRSRAGRGSTRPEKLRLTFALSLFMLTRPRRYGVVHLHGAYFLLRLLRRLKPLLGYRIVFKPTLVGQDDPVSISAVRPELVSSVDRWVCISTGIAERATAAGIADDRIVLLPNGVDLARFSAPASDEEQARLRTELGLPERTIWISVASVVPRKRIDLAVSAWSLLPVPRPLLLIVGPNQEADQGIDSEYVDSVRAGIDAAGLTDDIRLFGHVARIERILRAVDAFIFTSSREGLPNAVLEALASGLPVISTPFESVSDVEALANGRLHVVEADARALASAVSSTRYDRLVPASLRTVDLQSVAARYAEVYAGGDRATEPEAACV
jgi:glycosyltransferase involved in cell wall biosynthesis